MLSEGYIVKFWITNEEGFKEQKEESVFFHSKGKHRKAKEFIISKYRKKPFCKEIDVISVTYQ